MTNGRSLAVQLLEKHLVEGKLIPGTEIGLKMDQTLTQDATGTMAYLEFESMGIPRVKTELSVAYVDHNTLQCGFENADDHIFIQSAAKKFGVRYSRPGNGICHQVHLERFGIPGKTLIGSDSHTPTAGGLGMLAFGAGGLDVAVAMGGGLYYIAMPKIMLVRLTGKRKPYVTAKDIALEVLRRLSVKGGVGYILEWGGNGIRNLTVPERATITNMGAELGATSSLFPSDEQTYAFLKAQGREQDFSPYSAETNAVYDEVLDIDLSELEPLIACPHSPDNVKTVKEMSGKPVTQVCIGSCTNSSLADLKKVARILKGKHISPDVELSVSPGSKQVLSMLSADGSLQDILASGARLLECACGPCIGMGFSPNSGGVSLRTFNRNFEGRSGTKDANVYLCSPETAAVSALTGVITDPGAVEGIVWEQPELPEHFLIDDSAVLMPADKEEAKTLELVKGPNIGAFPEGKPLPEELIASAVLKVGDNITTDHIMPAGAKILPYRSNIPYLSKYCFAVCDPDFPERAKKAGNGIIIGGSNYGQGSSREHAALVPLFLGIRAVIAKSFARIHKANLINAGILPLTFTNERDYDDVYEGHELHIGHLYEDLNSGLFTVEDRTTGKSFKVSCELTERQKEIVRDGGLLLHTRKANGGS